MSSSKREKRQRAKRLGVLTDAQVAVGWLVIMGLAALVGALYLNQASRIASLGRKVQLMQNELDDLKRENAALERTIAEAQTLERLQQEAVRLGFVRAVPEDIEYMVVTGYSTEPVTMPAATPVPAPAVEKMGEAVWLAIQNSVSHLVKGESGAD